MSTAAKKKAAVKPWHKSQTVLKFETEPLIPIEYADVGNQRVVAISLWLALQAYKLYEVVWPEGQFNSNTFLVKFTVLDLLFLYLIPIFRIPLLTFNKSVLILLALVMSLANIILANNTLAPGAMLAAVYRTYFERELSLSGAKVKPGAVYQPQAHLRARYEVKILPESTACLNFENRNFCVDLDNRPWIEPEHFDVRFNASVPSFVQIAHYNFDTNTETLLNYTAKDLKNYGLAKSGTEKDINYQHIPVHAPGLYRLNKVLDTAGNDVRIMATDVYVAECPKARIVGDGAADASPDKCIGDSTAPRIVVEGLPPLAVKYKLTIKGRETSFSVESVQPTDFSSPLLHGHGLSRTQRVDANTDFAWARSHSVELDPMDSLLTSAGDWKYEIQEVSDGLGNKIVFPPSAVSSKAKDNTLQYGFKVHPRPRIWFDGCDAMDRQLSIPRGQKRRLPLRWDAQSYPLKVVITHEAPEGAVADTEYTLSQDAYIEVDKPGTYRIKSVQGKHCSGDVLESVSCLVTVPPEPALGVSFSTIEDKCAGESGAEANLKLSGTPPFHVEYHIVSDSGEIRVRTLDTPKSRETIKIEPFAEGRFVYAFKSVSDRNYRVDLSGDTFQMEQVIEGVAGAQFGQVRDTSRQPLKICPGETTNLPVHVFGKAPLTLTYEILSEGASRKEYAIENIDAGDLQITTSVLPGGKHSVGLVSVSDARGCVTRLESNYVHIDVRRQRPGAAFVPLSGRMDLKVAEDASVGLPLRLSGDGPWTVTYRYTAPDGTESQQSVSVKNANGGLITTNKAGKYWLVGVRDGQCEGEVVDQRPFEVAWIDKPTVRLAESSLVDLKSPTSASRREICQGEEDSLEIALTGAAPFVIHYDVQGPGEARKSRQMQVATRQASIKLESGNAGVYTYTLRSVYDSHYGKNEMRGREMQPITVTQMVNSKPKARFTEAGKIYKACVNTDIDNHKFGGIPLQLVGSGPFEVTVQVVHESSGKSQLITVPNVPAGNNVQLKSVFRELPIGKYSVALVRVRDEKGCVSDKFNDSERVYIYISDIPKLTPMSETNHLCVGQRLTFSLDGVPPFEIVYEFNGKRQKATTTSPFSRLASAPGNLTLVSLKDSASGCTADLSHFDAFVVHDIPSVRNIDLRSRDIHEGDEAELRFEFSGTPPFTFTYTRSERVGTPPRLRPVEAHSVTNVDDREYTILTSLEGEYEVIALEDRYCSISYR